MSNYYAVDRNSEYLAHYGVKGMKWGVRKAVERGNTRALAHHWKKANRKLEKLNNKANWEHQSKRRQKANSIAGYGFIGGASGGVSGLSTVKDKLGKYTTPAIVGAGLAGGILGSAIPVAISAKATKRLGSKGHAKALKKAHEWSKEMNRAFQGTTYQGKTKKFKDMYLTKSTKYLPNEAKRGNAMSYQITYAVRSGTDLAKEFDKVQALNNSYRNYLLGRNKKRRRT